MGLFYDKIKYINVMEGVLYHEKISFIGGINRNFIRMRRP